MGPREKTGRTRAQRCRGRDGTASPRDERDSSAPWRWLDWLWRNLPDERVSRCRRVRRGAFVEVRRSPEGAVWMEGLVTCGSVWLCPFCASSRSRLREAELRHAGKRWQALPQGLLMGVPGCSARLEGDPEEGEPWRLVDKHGNEHGLAMCDVMYLERPSLYLLTRTVRHGARQSLEWTAERLRAARDAWRAHRRTRAALARLGCEGTVRAGELTWGPVHGWHPHEHDLVFSTRVLSYFEREKVRAELAAVWVDCCLSVGLPPPSLEHGIDLRPTTVPEYLAKWGAAQEIALARQKRGRGGLNPWQLLDRAVGGDAQAAALFHEYARVYPGQRWVSWSKGLRARLLDDFELPEVEGELVAVVMPPQWSRLVAQGGEAVGAFLATFKPPPEPPNTS